MFFLDGLHMDRVVDTGGESAEKSKLDDMQ
jgi:hypothetical protein